MDNKPAACPDCADDHGLGRRDFLKTVGAGAAAAALPLWAVPRAAAAPTPSPGPSQSPGGGGPAAPPLPLGPAPGAAAPPPPSTPAETAVKALFEALTDQQRKEVCFDWDYQDKNRGLLRTFVSNNW